MSTPDTTQRLREIAAELPRAAYLNPNLDHVHALEDEAATLLGKRTVRQATDVVSACELWRALQAAIAPAPTLGPIAIVPSPTVPPGIAKAIIPARTKGYR